MHVRFASADIELIVHATESMEKVLDAVNSNLLDTSEFTATKLTGHFGNEIILLRCTLTAEKATHLAYKLLSSLSYEDIMHLYNNFTLYTDKGLFYIRLSKQDMIKGKIILSQTDSIRIRFKIAGGMQKTILEDLRYMLINRHED
jgi:RNA binding exosome subunit